MKLSTKYLQDHIVRCEICDDEFVNGIIWGKKMSEITHFTEQNFKDLLSDCDYYADLINDEGIDEGRLEIAYSAKRVLIKLKEYAANK